MLHCNPEQYAPVLHKIDNGCIYSLEDKSQLKNATAKPNKTHEIEEIQINQWRVIHASITIDHINTNMVQYVLIILLLAVLVE